MSARWASAGPGVSQMTGAPAACTIPTRAALEAAVLDLTDEQVASALCKVDRAVKAAYEERAAYAWPREAQLSLLRALATRLERGRVPAKS